jgi:hypothetical protein
MTFARREEFMSLSYILLLYDYQESIIVTLGKGIFIELKIKRI